MDYIILAFISVGCLGLIILARKIFLTKSYPKKTEKLYNDLKDLESLGFAFTGDKYEGNYRGFPTYIFVTTNMKGSDRVMVMVATDTSSGPIDFLNTFLTGYFKNGENGGCTYVSFQLFMRLLLHPTDGVQKKLDKLIDVFNEKSIQPFKVD